jgi:SAM-dependent methyltransferase
MDPMGFSSPWDRPAMVAGFERSPPNGVLMQFAAAELARAPRGLVVDIGCGAARNAVPLAETGWRVIGTDLSAPMLAAAATRRASAGVAGRVQLVRAAMDALPVQSRAADLVIAHGIWNLARSSVEFRRGVADAARIARPGAALFVFTFSRRTLPDDAAPVSGESFVFTQFSGQPQCFLTEDELIAEMAAAGFVREPSVPFSEYNRRPEGSCIVGGPPVIFEAVFRRSSSS